MKLSIIALAVLSSLVATTLAFSVLPSSRHDSTAATVASLRSSRSRRSTTRLAASTTTAAVTTAPLMDPPLTKHAIESVIATAKQLKQENGVFILDKVAKKELQDVVAHLEDLSEPPSQETYQELFLGDWTLLCTTAATDKQGVDTSKLNFLNQGGLKSIRDSIKTAVNKYLKVEQRIRSSDNGVTIDRVDHVLEYQPPEKLQQVLDNLPEQLTMLNINPLHVSKSRLVLIHKASVQSVSPLVTKLALKSIVLNVAGTSTFLDPTGKDVAAVNFPLGDFLQAGAFETTYMDESLRISRGKIGMTDQLRVFERTDRIKREEAYQEIIESDVSVGQGVNADMDVDEVADPDFVHEQVEADVPSDVEAAVDDNGVDVDEFIDTEFTDKASTSEEMEVEAPSDVEASVDVDEGVDVDEALDTEFTDDDDNVEAPSDVE